MPLFQLLLLLLLTPMAHAALQPPTDVEQPGTQPNELIDPIVGVSNDQGACINCHSGYETTPTAEPWHHWQGSMMSHAGRDPLFWATLAIAEQDFDGAGDLCLRCHAPKGWLEGRSEPTNGSALEAGDADGVECGFCHRLTNPDGSEHQGVQNPPYLANDRGDPGADPADVQPYLGSAMAVVAPTRQILGPYDGIDVRAHGVTHQSRFHRSVDFCGTCHDVSNPVVGDLAHNQGTQPQADTPVASGVPGAPVEEKAAFNNPPFRYGIVERTFSEYKAAKLSRTRIRDYTRLPAELQQGAIRRAREAALTAGREGDYADGTPRYFSCQSCHMPPVEGQGAGFPGTPPVRKDLPLHDLTGANYWVPQAIDYLDGLGKLRLGGGLNQAQRDALQDGIARATRRLREAAALQVTGNVLKVINLTGHKLISGYPEGRRMWLNLRWYDDQGRLLREDGAYGPLSDEQGRPVTVTDPASGQARQVHSLTDLEGTNTRIYEAQHGLTRQWARQLLAMGKPADLVIQYDRYQGTPELTLQQLAEGKAEAAQSFHFVLNNTILKDNRIPPYGLSYEEARRRNVLPVPEEQFGGGRGEDYRYFDLLLLQPPSGAVRADIRLMYQPTSWEYIQFLHLANEGKDPFLKSQGEQLLQAWLNTGMAAPEVMAQTTWRPNDCSGTDLLLDRWVFLDGRQCKATLRIRAREALLERGADVTLNAPTVALGPGFTVVRGARLEVITAP